LRNRPKLITIVILLGIFAHLLWYSVLWRGFVTSDLLVGLDYISYHAVGVIAKSGNWQGLYDIALQSDIQKSLGALNFDKVGVLPFLHPPVLVPILAAVNMDNYATSYWLWVVCLFLLVAVCEYLIYRILQKSGLQRVFCLLGVVTALVFYPLFISVLQGQDTVLLLLGGLLLLYGLIEERDWISGIGLALMTIRPQMALLFAIPYALRRRKAGMWFVAGSAVLVLYSILLIGFEGTRDYIGLLSESAQGVYKIVNQQNMANLLGILLRLFPTLPGSTTRIIGWGVYIIVLAGLCWLALSASDELHFLGIVFTLYFLVVPHIHYHDLSLLLLGVTTWIVLKLRIRTLSTRYVPAVYIGASMLLLISELMPARFRLVGVYVLAAFLILGLLREIQKTKSVAV
jgi:hypothetical protein